MEMMLEVMMGLVDMEVDKVADEVADMVVDMEVDKGQVSVQTTWPIFQFAVSQFQVWSIVIDNVKERDHTCQSESGLAEMTGALCL